MDGLTPAPDLPQSVAAFLSPSGDTITTAGLRAGQTFQTTVRGTPGNLSILLGVTTFTLDETIALAPGQLLRVEVVETATGLQLRLMPLNQTETQGAPATSVPLQALLASILQELGALEKLPHATSLLPAQLPATTQAIRQVISLFLGQDILGRDLQQLVTLINQAVAQGALPQTFTGDFFSLVAQFSAANTQEFTGLLKKLTANRSLEARLALAMKEGKVDSLLKNLQSQLRTEVARLRGNEALLTYLRGTRQLKTFEATVQHVMDRLSGAQAQNLHSLDQPYLFLDLPLLPDTGFKYAQLHFLSEGGGKQKKFDRNQAQVALDLATTSLGALWVSLNITNGHCRCAFRTQNSAVAELLKEASPELRQALDKAGYPNTEILVKSWDGDRIKETARLLRRFSGLNLNV
jgi:hypothetical protein